MPLYMFTNLINMHLYISPNRLISDIQKDFNNVFPFLKLEFFNNRSFSTSDFQAQQIIPHNRKVGDSQLTKTEGDIKIDEEMKVNELEKIFKEQFNLAVQVFRKSGTMWLETTMTDSWTLQQQNNHGMELSTVRNNNDKAEDYDLSRDADH